MRHPLVAISLSGSLAVVATGSAQSIEVPYGVGLEASPVQPAARAVRGEPTFIKNEGQWDPAFQFVAPLGDGFVLVLGDRVILQHVDRLDGDGAHGNNTVVELPFAVESGWWSVVEASATRFHFFRGCCEADWRRDVAAGSSIAVVSPGGRTLLLSLPAGRRELEFMGSTGGAPCGGEFEIRRFALGGPRPQRTAPTSAGNSDLPGVLWSGQFGASLASAPQDVVIHVDGTVTIVGETVAPDFPVTPGAWDMTFDGGAGTWPSDAFVSRLSADGSSLIHSTFLGGKNSEHVYQCLAAEDGGVILLGQTFSKGFPVTPSAVDNIFVLAESFLTRISPQGDSLVFSTLLGGSENDTPESAVEMPDRSLVVVGSTDSNDFPLTANAFDTVGGEVDSSDAFIARLSSDASSLIFSSYLGSPGNAKSDGFGGLAALDTNRVVVTGDASPGTLVPAGPFVALINTITGTIEKSASINGGLGPASNHLAIGPDGGLIMAGTAESPDFTGTVGAFDPTYNGQFDGFVARLKSDLSGEIDWLTFYGEPHFDFIYDMELDSAGHITVSGIANYYDLPTTAGAVIERSPGPGDLFVARFHRDGDRLLYGSYVGGSKEEYQAGNAFKAGVLGLDAPGGCVIAGTSLSDDFPVTPGAYGADTGPFITKMVVTRLNLLPDGVVRIGESTPGCKGPLILGVTAQPRLGATDFAIYAGGAAPNASIGLLLVGMRSLMTPMHSHQASVWVDPGSLVALVPWSCDFTGYAELPLRIPDDLVLVGFEAWVQAIFGDPCAVGEIASTPALGLTIQP